MSKRGSIRAGSGKITPFGIRQLVHQETNQKQILDDHRYGYKLIYVDRKEPDDPRILKGAG